MNRLIMFISLLLIILMCLSVPQGLGQEIKPKCEFNNTLYSYELNKHVYPMIKKYLKNYQRNISTDEAQQIIDELDVKLKTHFSERNLPIIGRPLLAVMKMQTETHCAYVLHVIIIFYDKKESTPNFHLTTEYSKRFVIFSFDKNTLVAGLNTNGGRK